MWFLGIFNLALIFLALPVLDQWRRFLPVIVFTFSYQFFYFFLSYKHLFFQPYIVFIIPILIFIVSLIFALSPYLSSRATTRDPEIDKNYFFDMIAKAREKSEVKKKKALEQIMVSLRQEGELNNSQIREIVKKSNWTVMRYMDCLEREGKVRQTAKTGRDTTYKLIS
jgi:hypothetical protein